MKKILLAIVAVVVCFSFLAFLPACNDKSASDSGGFTAEEAYDKAKILGFKGSLDEFIELLSGKDGVDGKDGADGAPGKDGVDGKDGIDGKDGVDGAPGADGKDGVDGINGADGKDGVDGEKGEQGEQGEAGKDGVGIKDVLITLETDTDGKTYFVFTIILSEGDPIVRKVLQQTESENKPEAAAGALSVVTPDGEKPDFVPVLMVDEKLAYKSINRDFLCLKLTDKDGNAKMIPLETEYLSPASGTGMRTIAVNYGGAKTSFKAYIAESLTDIQNCAANVSFDGVTLMGADNNLLIVSSGATFESLKLSAKIAFYIAGVDCVFVGTLVGDIPCDIENFSTSFSGKASDITTVTVTIGAAQKKLKFYVYVI
ncbi:MAG TPA: hypothetical protein DDY77_06860 [Clostridiales bacterium]|nr:hypothetical protein [Clostridiales bacterium]